MREFVISYNINLNKANSNQNNDAKNLRKNVDSAALAIRHLKVVSDELYNAATLGNCVQTRKRANAINKVVHTTV